MLTILSTVLSASCVSPFMFNMDGQFCLIQPYLVLHVFSFYSLGWMNFCKFIKGRDMSLVSVCKPHKYLNGLVPQKVSLMVCLSSLHPRSILIITLWKPAQWVCHVSFTWGLKVTHIQWDKVISSEFVWKSYQCWAWACAKHNRKPTRRINLHLH